MRTAKMDLWADTAVNYAARQRRKQNLCVKRGLMDTLYKLHELEELASERTRRAIDNEVGRFDGVGKAMEVSTGNSSEKT